MTPSELDRLVLKVEGKSILVAPPHDMSLKFDMAQMQSDITALMRKYGVYRIEAIRREVPSE